MSGVATEGRARTLDVSGFEGPVVDGHAVTGADLEGRRVGVLATSPLVADVVPLVVRHAAVTKVFTLVPVRVLPPLPLVGALSSVPALQARVASRYLRCAVRDKELRRKLAASRGDDRIVVSGDYLPALQSDACQVIAWPIVRITDRGIRTGDGLEHLVDVVVRA